MPLHNPVLNFANVDVKSSAVEGALVNSQTYLALQDVAALVSIEKLLQYNQCFISIHSIYHNI